MTKRELIELMAPLTDDAEILVLEDGQYQPAKARIHYFQTSAIVTIEFERAAIKR